MRTLAITTLLLALGCAQAPALPAEGQPAPGLRIPLFDGSQFDLAAHRGEVVLVNFWASWCDPCRAEMPTLDAFYLRHAGEGLVLVGVSGDRRRARDDAVQAMAPFHYPAGLLFDAELNGFGEPSLYPMTYVIDRQGKLARVLVPGARGVDEATLESAVAPLLREPRAPR